MILPDSTMIHDVMYPPKDYLLFSHSQVSELCPLVNSLSQGQYLVYSSELSIFEECIIVFQVLVYKQMLSFFEQRIIVFQAPAQFPRIKMSRIVLSIKLNFGCSPL